ncbi:excisionase family DNA-binding protein [Bordetella genomosp. 10]|nr:excisionase family DNA-binding protein [Bordetella genomosp. 10]
MESLESVVLTALKTVPRRQAKANSQDQVQERTVRMRRQGEPDRRFLVAYAIDPNDSEAVIFRIRPATSRDLGPARTPMLSTQQAADQLNVSRPYVVKLVEDGVFQGVERTQAGHRRIPAAEVARVQQAMQVSRRTALKRVDTLTSDLRQQELDEARTASKRRWVKTA